MGLGPFWHSRWCLSKGKREVNPYSVTIWDCHGYCSFPSFGRRGGRSFVSGGLAHPVFNGSCLMLCPRWFFYLSSIYFMSLIISIFLALACQSFLQHFPVFQNWWEEVMGENASAHRKLFWACFKNMYLFQNPGRSFHLGQKDRIFHRTVSLNNTSSTLTRQWLWWNTSVTTALYAAQAFSLFILFIYLFTVELAACGLIARVCPLGICCSVQSICYGSLTMCFRSGTKRAPHSLCWHWQLTPINTSSVVGWTFTHWEPERDQLPSYGLSDSR